MQSVTEFLKNISLFEPPPPHLLIPTEKCIYAVIMCIVTLRIAARFQEHLLFSIYGLLVWHVPGLLNDSNTHDLFRYWMVSCHQIR